MNASNSYMQITTKYLGASAAQIIPRGRIKASCEAGSVIVDYDHDLNSTENRYAACLALLNKLNWSGRYIEGDENKRLYYVCNN